MSKHDKYDIGSSKTPGTHQFENVSPAAQTPEEILAGISRAKGVLLSMLSMKDWITEANGEVHEIVSTRLVGRWLERLQQEEKYIRAHSALNNAPDRQGVPMPSNHTLRNEIREALGTFVFHYGIEANHPAGDLVEPYDEALDAILSAFLARLPKEQDDDEYADGWNDCLSEVKKLLEIE